MLAQRLRKTLAGSKSGSRISLKLWPDSSVELPVKQQLRLPGIIGSIIAGVLNFLKKVVAAAAGHVWLFLLSIATLIGYKLVDSFREKNTKKR